jgi:hypothetical protein
LHWCQLNVSWAVETAATQTKPACAGFKTLEFPLVRAGGLGFYRRDFQSPWLKLTPMKALRPYRWSFKGKYCVSPGCVRRSRNARLLDTPVR